MSSSVGVQTLNHTIPAWAEDLDPPPPPAQDRCHHWFSCGAGGLIVSRCQNEKKRKKEEEREEEEGGEEEEEEDRQLMGRIPTIYTTSAKSILIYCYTMQYIRALL